MLLNFLLFIGSLLILIKSAEYCTEYASKVARIFHLSQFIVSFFIVSFISVFPETMISVISAVRGVPEFGLGALLGSNVADLTLVFGIVALFSTKGIPVRSEILKQDFMYLFLLLVPLLVGWDGYFSRADGVLLIMGGVFFLFTLSFQSKSFKKQWSSVNHSLLFKYICLLVLTLIVLIAAANYTVKYGTHFASDLNIPAVLVSITIISIGTCLPELFFSIKAIKQDQNALALGDILGTVIIDATIIIGLLGVIHPFHFNPHAIYVTGVAMFIAGLLTILFIRTNKVLSKSEGIYLILFYLVYLIVEFSVQGLF